MASRSKQKEEARVRRLAEEQSRQERQRRERRLRMLGGLVLGAIAVVVVAIVVSTNGGSSPKPGSASAKQADTAVNSLLTGIPQSGNRLGSPNAKVIVTEFADLQCPVCKDFAEGAENQLISNDVRSGKVQLIYKSLSTATANGPNPNVFPTQQAAALAAGRQSLAWQYIELFYKEQGTEGTDYVTPTYLNDLAKQVPSLNYAKWSSNRNDSGLTDQIIQDQQLAASKGYNSTPTIVVQGKNGTAAPIVGNTDYSTLEARVKSVG